MLVGLDGIDGAAPISDEPFLFFGLERMNDSDLNILIPHEFNHLCRFQYLKDLENMNQLTVRQLIIAEGLATLTPLIMHQQPLSSEHLAKALMVTAKEYEDLQVSKEFIRTQITKDFDRKLSPELFATYFMANEESDLPAKAGYFYGTMIISSLLQSGFSLKELTYKKTEEIWFLYFQRY
nr:DUF2268 domain-containing putative Zn-dependent protease [Jeotgalibacillus terrae]